MTQPNTTIPKTLPTPEAAVNLFVAFRDKPVKMLGGLSLLQLLTGAQDVDRIWVVGSTAWQPAVLGIPPDGTRDIDIVFGIPGAAEDFITQAKQIMERSTEEGTYLIKYRTSKGLGTGTSLARTSNPTNGFLDAWDLPDGQSIAEHIMGFSREHERCAITIGALSGEVGALTRIVRPADTIEVIRSKQAAKDREARFASMRDMEWSS